ncbi:MAG: phosphoribosylglycinamide formyltransferase [Pseudomonadota bacterium]
MNPANKRTAVLISGSGTNLQAFIDRAAAGELGAGLALVLANRGQAYGLERARLAGIPTEFVDHREYASREAFDRVLAERLDAFDIEAIVLAGFMRILSPWFVRRYLGRIFNIHPALLPLYPGLDTHRRVLDAGDRYHGSTVHFVTEELDAGPRILQGRIPVSPSRDAPGLAARVQRVEHRIYPEALNWFASGRLSFEDGRAVLDGEVLTDPVVRDFD